MGYDVTLTPATGDEGRDIEISKEGKTLYVECKLYSRGNSVGRPDLQKLLGAMAADRIRRGIVVTTSSFGIKAQEFAKKSGRLDLIDGETLASLMEEFHHHM